MSVDEMCRFMGATSLSFLSVDGVYRALGHDKRDARHPQFTDHCFTGDYPTSLTDQNGTARTGQLSLLTEVS
jgi:amidophosphoribosyltransferase